MALLEEERLDAADTCLDCDGNCCPCSPVLDDDYDDDDEVGE